NADSYQGRRLSGGAAQAPGLWHEFLHFVKVLPVGTFRMLGGTGGSACLPRVKPLAGFPTFADLGGISVSTYQPALDHGGGIPCPGNGQAKPPVPPSRRCPQVASFLTKM